MGDYRHHTALYLAVNNGKRDMVQLIIDSSMKPLREVSVELALHLAALRGELPIMRILLAHCPNVMALYSWDKYQRKWVVGTASLIRAARAGTNQMCRCC